jgi:O-Antigen ligase
MSAEPDAAPREPLLNLVGWAAAILLPLAAVVYLSFNAGGFYPGSTGFAAVIFAQALAVRVMLAPRPFEGFDRRLAVPVLGLALLAAWQLASALWSHATARAFEDFDRTLLYLLALALFGSMAVTTGRVRWLVRCLFAALAAVCVIALLSRLVPSVWPTTPAFAVNRLSYPLTYTNAVGLLATLALLLGFHLTCDGDEPRAVRVLAAALLPAIATTLLLTFSRGAIAVAIVGLLVYVAVARPGALVTGLLAVGPTLAISLRSTYTATLLAGDNPVSPAAVSQGHHVARTVGACMLVAAGVRAVLLLADGGLARWQSARPRQWRLARLSLLSVIATGLITTFLALDGPGFVSRQYTRFVKGGAPQGQLTRDRLTDPYNDLRLPLWRVGMRAFRAQPLHGQGAGTYELIFAREREDATISVIDAHSLYVQTLAELGIVGLVLLVVALGGTLGMLAVKIRGPDGAVYGALLAAGVAWAVQAGVDWVWQMPAVTLWLFAAGGLALGRSTSTASPPAPMGLVRRLPVGLAVLGLAVLPLLMTLSFQRLAAAERALTNHDCPAARREAVSSLSYIARPQPYAIVGFCEIQQGEPRAAVAAMSRAVAYEPANWEYRYALALARAATGMNPMSTLRAARTRNPHEWLIATASDAFAKAPAQRWPALAQALTAQALVSGELNDV